MWSKALGARRYGRGSRSSSIGHGARGVALGAVAIGASWLGLVTAAIAAPVSPPTTQTPTGRIDGPPASVPSAPGDAGGVGGVVGSGSTGPPAASRPPAANVPPQSPDASNAMAVASNQDGRLEAFWLANGLVVHAYQLAPNYGWSSVEPLAGGLPGAAIGAPQVLADAQDRLVVVVDTGAGTWSTAQVAANAPWSSWTLIGPNLHVPALGYLRASQYLCLVASAGATAGPSFDEPCYRQNSPLVIFYGQPAGGVLEAQVQDSSGTWQIPVALFADPHPGQGTYAPVAFVHHLAGAPQAAAAYRGASLAMVCDAFASSGNNCVDLGAPPGGFASPLAAASNDDGRAEIYALAGDHGLWHVYELGPGQWTGWEPLFRPFTGATLTGTPQVQRNTNGALEVAMSADDGSVRHIFQYSSNSSWNAGWYSLGLTGSTAPRAMALAANADGRLEVFAVGSGSQVTHAWQAAPSTGPWSPFVDL